MMESKKIIIFGATGLIGRALVKSLIKDDYSLIIVTRNPEKAKKIFPKNVQFQTLNAENYAFMEDAHAVINLAGENIASKRWTKAQKQKIIHSRVNMSKTIISNLNSLKNKPQIYMQASAIGFYPFSSDHSFTETDGKGNSFLSEVVDIWEKETNNLDNGIRCVILRTGVVLSKNGGMLTKVLLPMKFFIGGKLGNGKQWISWIHIEDEINAIKFLLQNPHLQGKFNLCAAHPVQMKTFIKSCGKILKRPTLFAVPAFIIRTIFGQMGKETILGSQKVLPKKLIDAGFDFQYNTVEIALQNLIYRK